MRKYYIIIPAVVVALAGSYIAYRKFFRGTETKVLETARVARADIRGVLVETGIIKPQVGAVVKVGSRATGTIVKMNVKVGDQVKAGDLIALIDDRDIMKRLERQKAALDAEKNTLRQIELTYPQRIKEAQATYNYARVNYHREKELLKNDYTTLDSVDQAESQFRAAEAVLRRLTEEQKTQLAIVKANIEEISAQIRELEVTLSYTRIYAPIDGVVSDVTLQQGETIVAGLQVANLVTILDPTSLEMQIYVDETNVGRTRIDQEVEYYVDSFPDRIFHGRINKIYPQPQTKDNIVYYLAIVTIPKEDAQYLKPEMTTHVKVIYEEKKDVLSAPNSAIKFEEGKQIAYKVLGPNKVEKLILKTGLRGEDMTEISSGAQEGDELATKIILPIPPKAQ